MYIYCFGKFFHQTIVTQISHSSLRYLTTFYFSFIKIYLASHYLVVSYHHLLYLLFVFSSLYSSLIWFIGDEVEASPFFIFPLPPFYFCLHRYITERPFTLPTCSWRETVAISAGRSPGETAQHNPSCFWLPRGVSSIKHDFLHTIPPRALACRISFVANTLA